MFVNFFHSENGGVRCSKFFDSFANIEISAELTIKNITNKVLIHSYIDFNKNTSKGQLIIDRTKWNIKYGSNSFYNLGDKAIYDDFLLNFELFPGQ